MPGMAQLSIGRANVSIAEAAIDKTAQLWIRRANVSIAEAAIDKTAQRWIQWASDGYDGSAMDRTGQKKGACRARPLARVGAAPFGRAVRGHLLASAAITSLAFSLI